MLISLEGQVAIVTGASGGLGGAIVGSLLEAGCTVVSTDLTEASSVVSDRVIHKSCDITAPGSSQKLVEYCQEEFGRLDILVNNAGINSRADFFEVTEDSWRRLMEVNVNSYFFLSQAAARLMRETKTRGSIINMASVAADILHPNITAYATSKGAVRSLTYAMAVALGPYGIRVNALAPGTVATNLNKNRWQVPGVREDIVTRTPLGRLGDPRDIGPAIVYLASEYAAFITGAVLHIDGGRLHVASPST